MGNSIKSSDLAQQLKNEAAYGFSGEEIRQVEERLDLLDGTRDGQVNLDRVSRETVAGELGKIITAKAGPARGGIWRNVERIAGVLTRAEAAGKEKSARPVADDPAPGVVEQVGDDAWKELQEFGLALEDGFYGRSPESRYADTDHSQTSQIPSGRLVTSAPEEDIQTADLGFQVINPEVMTYQSVANQLLVGLNGQFGMSPERLYLKDTLSAITNNPSPQNCTSFVRYALNADQKAEIEGMSGVLRQAADKIGRGGKLSFEEREGVRAATSRMRDILDAAKPAARGGVSQARIAVSNPVQILANRAPEAVMVAEEAIEQAPVIARNPVRIIVNQAPAAVRSAAQAAEEQGALIARNPVRIIMNSGPATVAVAEEVAEETLVSNGVNTRNVLVGTGVGASGAGMAGVITEVAAYGAAAAVGVGLGAAVVYSGAGGYMPVLGPITFKQAGDWLGASAYRLTHSE
ncbi:MAG TPA: hypothetical protein VFX30_04460 [bacterium]|nr:hypothetical protein [bacterium]